MEDAIVFYCPPHMGHIVSMSELAKLILLHNPHRKLSLTVMYGSDPFEPPTTNTALSKIIAANPSITFLHLPNRPVVDTTSQTLTRCAISLRYLRNSAPDAADALRRISAAGANIRAFIIDMFCGTAIPFVADQGIPVYCFFTSGVAALAAYLHLPTVDRREGRRVFEGSSDLLIDIPGLPAILATEMPEPVVDGDEAYREMVYLCENLRKSKGVLVNTFDDLEPVVMEAVAGGRCVPEGPTPPVYNIGPLIEGSKDGDNRFYRIDVSRGHSKKKKSSGDLTITENSNILKMDCNSTPKFIFVFFDAFLS